MNSGQGSWDEAGGRDALGKLTLPRLKPGDARRTLVATHYVSPRRLCPSLLDFDSITGRRLSTGSRSRGAHPSTRRYCLYPWERLYHGTRRNRMLLCKVLEHVYHGPGSLSSGWKQSPRTTDATKCLEFLRTVFTPRFSLQGQQYLDIERTPGNAAVMR